jgi:hypothetical protein
MLALLPVSADAALPAVVRVRRRADDAPERVGGPTMSVIQPNHSRTKTTMIPRIHLCRAHMLVMDTLSLRGDSYVKGKVAHFPCGFPLLPVRRTCLKAGLKVRSETEKSEVRKWACLDFVDTLTECITGLVRDGSSRFVFKRPCNVIGGCAGRGFGGSVLFDHERR